MAISCHWSPPSFVLTCLLACPQWEPTELCVSVLLLLPSVSSAWLGDDWGATLIHFLPPPSTLIEKFGWPACLFCWNVVGCVFQGFSLVFLLHRPRSESSVGGQAEHYLWSCTFLSPLFAVNPPGSLLLADRLAGPLVSQFDPVRSGWTGRGDLGWENKSQNRFKCLAQFSFVEISSINLLIVELKLCGFFKSRFMSQSKITIVIYLLFVKIIISERCLQ